ncbi:MAG TPA: type II secretion system F family protein [Ilumatobacteraceae bacterium]|nr:type II secretion system F family protein [Ilumatobacteraceae bacterium]
MVTSLLAGTLVVLVGVPVARRLRSGFRLLGPEVVGMPRSRRSTADYASLLDSITRQVRSGSSLTSAVGEEIGRCHPLREVAERLTRGCSLAEALAVIEPRDPDLALTVQALSASAHLGGPIALTLDDAAAVLRERAAARAERRAHGAQARLSARVLTIVPLGFAGWSVVASTRTRDVYLSSLAGGICALCGLTLNVAGWHWMNKIIGAP